MFQARNLVTHEFKIFSRLLGLGPMGLLLRKILPSGKATRTDRLFSFSSMHSFSLSEKKQPINHSHEAGDERRRPAPPTESLTPMQAPGVLCPSSIPRSKVEGDFVKKETRYYSPPFPPNGVGGEGDRKGVPCTSAVVTRAQLMCVPEKKKRRRGKKDFFPPLLLLLADSLINKEGPPLFLSLFPPPVQRRGENHFSSPLISPSLLPFFFFVLVCVFVLHCCNQGFLPPPLPPQHLLPRPSG